MDACQDVFVRLLEQRNRLESRHPSSLLYTIATNLCLNRIRDGGSRMTNEYDERVHRIASAGSPGAPSEARLLLGRLFRRHPASSRTIAVLHYLDGLTLEETATQVGLSVSGVRKRLRALRRTITELGL